LSNVEQQADRNSREQAPRPEDPTSQSLVVGAICARGGSKGVPRKALRCLCGVTLLERAVQAARESEVFDVIVVSTDDAEIADAAAALGVVVPFLRPAELARDDSPKWPVFQHLISEFERITAARISVLADLDVSAPLRTPTDIRQAVSLLEDPDTDVAITAYLADRNPYFNMVELRGEYAFLVKALDSPVTQRQDAPVVYALSGAVFAMRRDFILRSAHWSMGRVRVCELPRERALDIDSELDFEFAKFLMNRTSNGGSGSPRKSASNSGE